MYLWKEMSTETFVTSPYLFSKWWAVKALKGKRSYVFPSKPRRWGITGCQFLFSFIWLKRRLSSDHRDYYGTIKLGRKVDWISEDKDQPSPEVYGLRVTSEDYRRKWKLLFRNFIAGMESGNHLFLAFRSVVCGLLRLWWNAKSPALLQTY